MAPEHDHNPLDEVRTEGGDGTPAAGPETDNPQQADWHREDVAEQGKAGHRAQPGAIRNRDEDGDELVGSGR
jgi:hypothetical protein